MTAPRLFITWVFVQKVGLLCSFSQEWEYRPSGVLMIGLNRSIGLSEWSVFGEIGALAHRSKHRYAVHNLSQLVVIAELGTTRKLEKLRLSTSIWGASLPESGFSLSSAPFTSAEANKFWVGIAARASYACSPKVFINTGFHYGSTIYEDSIRSITGSSYGETLHRPGWMELGVILFL